MVIRSVLTSDNLLLLPDGSMEKLSPKVLERFINAELQKDDFRSWKGTDGNWISKHTDILKAAALHGKVVAYYKNDVLVIVDQKEWENRVSPLDCVTTAKGYSQLTGMQLRTVQRKCKAGEIKAKFEHGVWLIQKNMNISFKEISSF